MNNFKTDINGGLPFRLDDLRFITAAQMEAFKGTIQSIIGDLPYAILNGCQYSIIGNNWHLTEGYVYFNGEIFYAPSQDLAPVTTGGYFWDVNVSYDHSGDKTFNDGVVQLTYQIRQAHCVFKDTGTEGTMPPMLMDDTVKIMRNRLGIDLIQPVIDLAQPWIEVPFSSSNVSIIQSGTLDAISGLLYYKFIGSICFIRIALNLTIKTANSDSKDIDIKYPPSIAYKATDQTGSIASDINIAVSSSRIFHFTAFTDGLHLEMQNFDVFEQRAYSFIGEIFFEIQ